MKRCLSFPIIIKFIDILKVCIIITYFSCLDHPWKKKWLATIDFPKLILPWGGGAVVVGLMAATPTEVRAAGVGPAALKAWAKLMLDRTPKYITKFEQLQTWQFDLWIHSNHQMKLKFEYFWEPLQKVQNLDLIFCQEGNKYPKSTYRYYKPTQTLQKYQTSNPWTAFDSTLSQIGSQSYIIQFRSIFLGRWRASAVLKLRFISHYFFLEQLFWTGTEMVWGWLLRLQMKWVVRKNSKEASMHDFKNMDFTGNMLRLKLLPF